MSGEPFDFERSVTVAQYARLNGVSVFTVWRWIARGKIRARKTPGGHWRALLEKEIPKQTLTNTGKHEQG